MFLAICYREASAEKLQEFQEEVQKEGKMTEEMGTIFETLSKPNPTIPQTSEKKKKKKSSEPWYGIELVILYCMFLLHIFIYFISFFFFDERKILRGIREALSTKWTDRPRSGPPSLEPRTTNTTFQTPPILPILPLLQLLQRQLTLPLRTLAWAANLASTPQQLCLASNLSWLEMAL